MEKLIIGLSILFCLTTRLSYAASENCPPAAAVSDQELAINYAKNATDHGFLWRMSKGDHTSYLYGTIHIAELKTAFPGPITKKALFEVDTVALELDMLDPEIGKRLGQAATSNKQYEIPSELVEKIKQAAKVQCFSYEPIANLMPEMQIMTLHLLEARRDGLYVDYGIDTVLSGVGHGAKKEVISLETPELQMAMIAMDSQQDTITFVEEGLAELGSGDVRKLTLRIYDGWVSSNYQDFERYEDWCKCMDTETDRRFMARILDDRNITLAEKVDQLHASGKAVFTAVGALHMFGEKGLPSLLRKQGYQVERVQFN